MHLELTSIRLGTKSVQQQRLGRTSDSDAGAHSYNASGNASTLHADSSCSGALGTLLIPTSEK